MNNKLLRIIVDAILVVLGIVFLVFGIKDLIREIDSNKIEDSVRFKHDYSYVSNDNEYEYISIKEFSKLLASDKNVILVGDPLDTWTQVLVKPLDDEVDSTIYYYEINKKDSNSKYYDDVLSKLDIEEFTTPMIIVIDSQKVNKILTKEDLYEEDYDGVPLDYWTDERIEKLKF